MLAPEIRTLSCPSIPPLELLARLRIHFPQTALFQKSEGTAYIGCEAQCWLGWDEQFIWSYNRSDGSWNKQRYLSLSERDAYWRRYWEQFPDAHWMGYAHAEEGYWAAYRYVFKQSLPGGSYALLEQAINGLSHPLEDLERYLYQIPRKLLPFEHWGEVEKRPRQIVEKQTDKLPRPIHRNLQHEQIYRGSAFSYFQQQHKTQHRFFIEATDRQWAGQSPELALIGKAGKWERPLYLAPPNQKAFEWTAAQRWAVDLALADLASIGIKAELSEEKQPSEADGRFSLSFEVGDKALKLLQALASPQQLGAAGWFQAKETCLVPLLQLHRFLGKRHRYWEE